MESLQDTKSVQDVVNTSMCKCNYTLIVVGCLVVLKYRLNAAPVSSQSGIQAFPQILGYVIWVSCDIITSCVRITYFSSQHHPSQLILQY